jgi:hypothetical protein
MSRPIINGQETRILRIRIEPNKDEYFDYNSLSINFDTGEIYISSYNENDYPEKKVIALMIDREKK